MRRLGEQLLDALAHERHARGAAHEDDLVDLSRRQPGVGQRLAARAERAGDQWLQQPLDLRPGDHAVIGEAGQRQRERRALLGRQPDLRRLGGQPQLLHELVVAREIDAVAVELRVVPGLDVLEQP